MPAQQQLISMYPELEDAFATTNQNWNGPYWLENAIQQDELLSLGAEVALRKKATLDVQPALCFASDAAVTARPTPSSEQLSSQVIVCPTIDSIPPGRQTAKVLQCGICNSDKLFDRKYDLERHMRTHTDGAFPCTVAGCDRQGQKAFKGAEHLRNHLQKMHGQ
ncbi:hypothetical protein PRZ48_012941 [Zasmidium cellare]|uniref:C2H2-type domain-containing protein n=1 Tax=Zasmidium cellare TaxID=395010 RepID=A0ABR0E3J3_ZASCE|nr:hypothetical protein PRZ48_012941 [Zasmidium cellare]